MTGEKKSVFWASFFEQKKSLEKLIEESRADSAFYLLLSVSAFITTLGLLIDNAVVVIGGMLVAPLLFPILSLAMGITTANIESIGRSITTIGKSIFAVVVISGVTAFLFRDYGLGQEIINRAHPDLTFFLIAFSAGLAVSYSWVKQNVAASLPGVAVSVALLPPLAAVGIGIAFLDASVVSGATTLFLINLLGIALAAMIIFLLFGFSYLKREEKKLIEDEKVDQLIHEKAKLDKTKQELEEVTEKIEEKVNKVDRIDVSDS